jgi:integrase
MTVGQLCLLFIQHADGYYQLDGEPTGEADNFRKSAKYLNALFRTLPVDDFGPKRLLEVRQRMIDDGVVRKSINRHVAPLKHIFKCGVSRELVSAEVHTALSTVSGLREGRTVAKEGEPVQPVPEEGFERAVAKMTANVAAICRLLLLLTGARVSEIRLMRVGDVDTTGNVWFYRSGSHKNFWSYCQMLCSGMVSGGVLEGSVCEGFSGQ